MGGKALITDLAEKYGKQMIEGFGRFMSEEGAPNWVRSTRAVLNRQPIGKAFGDFLEHTLEPEVKRTGQTYLDAKIKQGLPAHIAATDAGKEAWHDVRKAYLGQNDEALIKFIHSASKQHGPAYGNSVADAMSVYFHDASSYWRTHKIKFDPSSTEHISLKNVGIRSEAEYREPKEFEKSLRQAMGWMYTPTIAIPHLSQVGNTVFNEGISSTARALAEYTSALAKGGATKQKVMNDVIKSGALFDEIRFQMMEDAKGGGIVRQLFHHPGFGWVRRQELAITALAAKNTAQDAMKVINRYGPGAAESRKAIFNLNRLGLKWQDIAEKGMELTDEDLHKAMYNGANQAIFIRSELYTPYKWEESFSSRMGFQYKQFAFRQGRFLAMGFQNAYRRDGVAGLAKAVAVYGTMFPVFGELVHSLENIATGKNPLQRDHEGGAEYFDALGHAAGLGIVYSMFRSGMYNYGRGFLTGPLWNTIEDLAIGVPIHVGKGINYSLEDDEDKATKQYRAAVRLAVSKLSIPGRIASNLLKEDKE